MAEFSKLVITAKGQALIAKMIAGVGNIEFTKVSASSTTYTLSQLEALTALSNESPWPVCQRPGCGRNPVRRHYRNLW